jgi:hypothetical protein
MEDRKPTHHDAELILKLYDLRREEILRKARHWVIFEFAPKDAQEFFSFAQGNDRPQNAYFRQVITYWEMAASMVLRGVVQPDLFLDTNGEGIFILAKFHPFRAEYQERTGRPFMRHTAGLVEKIPTAAEIFQTMRKALERRTS